MTDTCAQWIELAARCAEQTEALERFHRDCTGQSAEVANRLHTAICELQNAQVELDRRVGQSLRCERPEITKLVGPLVRPRSVSAKD